MPECAQWLMWGVTTPIALVAVGIAVASWLATRRQAVATEDAVKEAARSADAAERAEYLARVPKIECEVGEPEGAGWPFIVHLRVHTRLDELTIHFLSGSEPARQAFMGFAGNAALHGVAVHSLEKAVANDVLDRPEVPVGATCTLRIQPVDHAKIPRTGRAVMVCECRRGKDKWEVVVDTGDVELRPGGQHDRCSRSKKGDAILGA
jgi:hypothetical protein